MRKKVGAVVLVMMMVVCVLFTGCGGKDGKRQVEKSLRGSWTGVVDEEKELGVVYTFDHGQVALTALVMGMQLPPNLGTYEIEDSVIIVQLENGVKQELPYVYENGKLSLENEDGSKLSKMK